MKKNQLQSIIMTALHMERTNLISKETVKSIYEDLETLFADPKTGISIYDDLERFFEDLKNEKLPWYRADTYFLPELTEVEMALVDKNDHNFGQTFRRGFWSGQKSPRSSDSESKFILTECERTTYRIVLTPGGNSSHSEDRLRKIIMTTKVFFISIIFVVLFNKFSILIYMMLMYVKITLSQKIKYFLTNNKHTAFRVRG